jgi:hypothetical protein
VLCILTSLELSLESIWRALLMNVLDMFAYTQKALNSVVMSVRLTLYLSRSLVCLSACMTSAPTGRILVKFDTGCLH